MGVIETQAIRKSIVQYIALVVGFLGTYFVYNKYNQFYGLSSVLIDAAVLLSTFMTLGVASLSIRYFPEFKDTNNSRSAFFTFLVSIACLGISLSFLVFFSFKDSIVPFLSNDDDPLFEAFILWSFPLAILISFRNLLSNYVTNYKKIVINGVANSLFHKTALPLIILTAVYMSWSFKTYVLAVFGMFAAIILILFTYIMSLDKIRIVSFKPYVNREKLKDMAIFAFYGLFGSLGTFLATKIDTIFVAKYVDVASSGTYKVMSYFATLLEVPYMSILGIAAPIVASKLQEDDIKGVRSIYHKSSQVLTIVGFGVLLGIALNATDLFNIMPKKETTDVSMAFFVVLCLGCARLVDASTSINTHIIIYSKYFRFNFYSILILSVINISLNYMLVPKYGMRGVAIATLASIFLFNLVKIIYVKMKFDLWPFTKVSVIVFLIGISSFLLIYFIPLNFHPVINIAIRCICIAVLYLLPLYLLGYLDEIISNIWKQVKKILGQ